MVLDDGIGMSPEDVKNVFNSFWKSTDSDSQLLNPLGNGVGLSICKQIC